MNIIRKKCIQWNKVSSSGRNNREAGANPARSRHCNRGVGFHHVTRFCSGKTDACHDPEARRPTLFFCGIAFAEKGIRRLIFSMKDDLLREQEVFHLSLGLCRPIPRFSRRGFFCLGNGSCIDTKEDLTMEFHTHFVPQTIQPQEIEDRSFSIIAEELGDHDFSEEQFPIVQRVIHATADFELGRSLRFHPQAVRSGVEAIRAGKGVVADVQMVQVGISKPRISKFGGDVRVFISDLDVAAEARRLNTTRAIIAMRKAAAVADGAIFAIGNAPTALLELIRLVKEGALRPGLIVGVPVGFVSAAEAKDELRRLDIPYITNLGRKGGSPVAVAIVNALSLLAVQAGD